jgi:acyl-CoA hydrolase
VCFIHLFIILNRTAAVARAEETTERTLGLMAADADRRRHDHAEAIRREEATQKELREERKAARDAERSHQESLMRM